MQLDRENITPLKIRPMSHVDNSSALHVTQHGGPLGVQQATSEKQSQAVPSPCASAFTERLQDSTIAPSCQWKRNQTKQMEVSTRARTGHKGERFCCPSTHASAKRQADLLRGNLGNSQHVTGRSIYRESHELALR